MHFTLDPCVLSGGTGVRPSERPNIQQSYSHLPPLEDQWQEVWTDLPEPRWRPCFWSGYTPGHWGHQPRWVFVYCHGICSHIVCSLEQVRPDNSQCQLSRTSFNLKINQPASAIVSVSKKSEQPTEFFLTTHTVLHPLTLSTKHRICLAFPPKVCIRLRVLAAAQHV